MNKFISSLVLAASPFSVMAADLSNGADNFFKSDKVTMEKVTFKNQYKMNVAGNLFIPDNLNRNTTSPAIIFSDIETISPLPMLFITGDAAHSKEFSEDAYTLAGQPKELVIVPNAGHVDLYDRVNLSLPTHSARAALG